MKTTIPFEKRLIADRELSELSDTAAADMPRRGGRRQLAATLAQGKAERAVKARRPKTGACLTSVASDADMAPDAAEQAAVCSADGFALQQISAGLRNAQLTAFRSSIRDIGALADAEFAESALALLRACTYIDIDFSAIPDDKHALLLSLLSNPDIIELRQMSLNVSASSVALDDVMTTLAAMSLHNARLKIRIKIAGRQIDPQNAVNLAAAMIEARVTHLSLSDNALGNAGVTAIFNALQSAHVTHLELPSNGIDYFAAPVIADHLAQSSLASLNLNRNRVSDPGSAAIAGVLPQSQLTSLSLCFNRISQGGAASFANTLPNSSIIRLDLRGNNVGDHGASHIAAVLPQCAMTWLGLRENNIGDTGVGALMRVLPNSAVTTLDLRGNNIRTAGISAIEYILSAYPSIRILR